MPAPAVSRWGRPSIGLRLVVPVTIIVAAVLLVFLLAAIGKVRTLTIQTAEERLERIARQLAAVAQTSVHTRSEEARRLAELPEMKRFLAAPSPASRSALQDALSVRVGADEDVLALALCDAKGERLLSLGAAIEAEPWLPPLGSVAGDSENPAAAAIDAAAFTIGPLRAAGGEVFYDVWLRVPAARDDVAFIGQRVAVQLSPTLRDLVRGLVGVISRSATISYGNGEVWTDLAEVVPPPAAAAYFDQPAETGVGPFVQRLTFEEPGIGGRIAAIATVTGTPWKLVVERDEAAVLASVTRMARRLGGLAVALALVAALGALFIGRTISRPLDRITHATRSMASFGELPGISRAEEIARLTEAFRRMRGEVKRSRAGLESEIRERTAELESAVHELESTQDELVRREKMNTLGQLSAAVSHEFHNCLAVIRNAVFVITARESGHNERVDRSIGALARQVELCEQIIRNLVEMGATQSPHRRRVRLQALIDEQLDRLTVPAGVDIVREPGGEGEEACVDPVQVGQALFNLLTNAVQAMGGSGTLTLRSARRSGGFLELAVADTGPGIPQEELDLIFEPLYTTKSSGTGLGLSVSRALVRGNGGDITVRNEGGAVFTLVLPAEESAEAPGAGGALEGEREEGPESRSSRDAEGRR